MRIFFKLSILFFFLYFSNLQAQDEIFSKDYTNRWKRVYLATYPRSGNHWFRFLIEDLTGIATSSVYRDPDPPHDPDLYPWGGYSIRGGYIHTARFPTEEDLVFIKTHYPALHKTERDSKFCIKNVRIIRHPIDSFYSHYCYRHIPPKIIPYEWVKLWIPAWKRFQKYWNDQPNVITIRYEDLMVRPFEVIKHLNKVLNLEKSEEEIFHAINSYPPIGHPLKHFEHYSQEELDLINEELGSLMDQFGYTISDINYDWDGTELNQYE